MRGRCRGGTHATPARAPQGPRGHTRHTEGKLVLHGRARHALPRTRAEKGRGGGAHTPRSTARQTGACVAGAGAAHTPPLPAHHRGQEGTRATLEESWYSRQMQQRTTNKATNKTSNTNNTNTKRKKPTRKRKQGKNTGPKARNARSKQRQQKTLPHTGVSSGLTQGQTDTQ